MAEVYAWRGFSGKRADGEVIQGIIPQFDGSKYASANCGPASEAMRIASQQQGRRPSVGSPWFPTGAKIRAVTGDTSGGTTPGQTTRAGYAIYRVSYGAPRIDDWQDVLGLLWSGHAVDLLVSYGPIDDVRSGSPGFRGNHRVLLVGIRGSYVGAASGDALTADPLYDGRRRGIPRGAQWIPLTVLRLAASRLRITSTQTLAQYSGSGKAYFIPSLVAYRPAPTIPTPKVVTSTVGSQEDSMIAPCSVVTTKLMRLAKGQPCSQVPGGKVVTRMSKTADVGYIGPAYQSGGWVAVLVNTGRPYKDGKTRPTQLYVPKAAGPIRSR